MGFKEDMSIDESALDVEFLRHPSLYRKYAEDSAYCNDRLRRAEQKLKLVRSDLFLKAKNGEVRDLGPKPTDAAVEAYYRTHPKHIEAKEEYMEAARDAELASSAIFALNSKKTSLENLVKLLQAQYYAGPSEPRNLSKEFAKQVDDRKEERKEEVRDRIREGLNRSNPKEDPSPARSTRRRINEE